MDDALLAAIGDLLAAARISARTPDVQARIDEMLARLNGPLRVAIAGKVKAGKSTLLNAVLSEELAPTDAGECTQIVTWYQQSEQPQVVLYPHDGGPETRSFRREGGALEIDLGARTPADVDHLEVRWPTPRLRDLTLIDTPGIASISADVSARTHRVLSAEEDQPVIVDAVLYLLRHTHSSDIRFLESFHDDELAHGTPMNAVGVLSRADEIGSCRLDAMEVADRVAGRYQGDERLRRLCPVVIPVAGLLGYAGSTLRETEFRALARFATLPADARADILLSADRFANRPAAVSVTELERVHLLQRLGLFGVRLAIELIASGATPDASALSARLIKESGLDRLRQVLARQFLHRSRLLKARSALVAFEAVLQTDGCIGVDSLRARSEQIVAGAHEFEEVRLLNQLRTDGFGISADRTAELERLLGGSGHDAASRLGLPEDTGAESVHAATLDALRRWQRIAEHPVSSRAAQLAARGASRTLEGLLSARSDGP